MKLISLQLLYVTVPKIKRRWQVMIIVLSPGPVVREGLGTRVVMISEVNQMLIFQDVHANALID